LSRTNLLWITILLAFGVAGGSWAWYRYGPSDASQYQYTAPELPVAQTLATSQEGCDLTVQHYRQIGRELQFELYASAGGLAPYSVEIIQKGKTQRFPTVPHRAGTWLTIRNVQLADGPATVSIRSESRKGCTTTAAIEYKGALAGTILNESRWIRQGSEDNWLDVRPEIRGGKLFLKDFANYNDGRTRVYLIDNIRVENLEQGIEIKPGYLYSVIACWIDAPYSEWWNHLRYRTIRQQNVWIDEKAIATSPTTPTTLQKIEIPDWFSPSRTFNVQFDTKFPEFAPIPGKLVMQYRLNADVPVQNYLNRGITHLPRWEEKSIPNARQHWTEGPSFFGDRDQEWFSTLSKKEVEAYADRITPLGVYGLDFEYWNNDYTPAVKQRLLWFAQRLKERNPSMLLFDYWGGSAYRNRFLYHSSKVDPGHFLPEYKNPSPNHPNFTKLPDGDFLGNYFNLSIAEVYPRSFFGENSNTHNNYLILSGLHTARMNKLIPFQKNNKVIWFCWNRYQPQYKDPINPWHVETSNPKGDLIVNQMVTLPASQALGLSMFSLITGDGYYLWHDDQPFGRGSNNYNLSKDSYWPWEWYPTDGRTGTEQFRKRANAPESPRYWDYPSEYFVLGNWMAKQVEDIIVGGKIQDLAFQLNGKWNQPQTGQAVLAAMNKAPFVTSVVKGNKIVVLALDSFQSPTQNRAVLVRLPNGKETTIQLYGNWPSLYRGEM
jgi:hypothetical protein